LVEFLSQHFGVPAISLEGVKIDETIIKVIPADVARKYTILPISKTGAKVTIAMIDPTNVFAMDDIKFMTGYNVEPVVASESAVTEAIFKYYPTALKGPGGGSSKKEKSEPAVTPSGPSTLEMASKGLEELQQSLDDQGDVEVLEELQEISA